MVPEQFPECRPEPGSVGSSQCFRGPQNQRHNPCPQHRQNLIHGRPVVPPHLELDPGQGDETRHQTVRGKRITGIGKDGQRKVVDIQYGTWLKAVAARAGHGLHGTPPRAERPAARIDGQAVYLAFRIVLKQSVGVVDHPQRHRGIGPRLEFQMQQDLVLPGGCARQGPNQIPVPPLLVGRLHRIGRHGGTGRQFRGFETLQFRKQVRGVVPDQISHHVPFGEQGLQGEVVGEGRFRLG